MRGHTEAFCSVKAVTIKPYYLWVTEVCNVELFFLKHVGKDKLKLTVFCDVMLDYTV